MSGRIAGLRIGALAVIAGASTVATEGKAGSAIDWSLLQPPPNFFESYARGFEQGRAIAAGRAARAAARQAEATRQDVDGSRARALKEGRARTAGRLIADGQCQDARSYALTEGDLDLALQVAKLCPYAPSGLGLPSRERRPFTPEKLSGYDAAQQLTAGG
jgi:hypothetical protein